MLLETRRLWFTKAVFFLEEHLPSQKELERRYSSVDIISHRELPFSWRVREKDTAIIDLTQTEEKMFRAMSDTTRNEIRRTYDNQRFRFAIGTPEEGYLLYQTFEKFQGRKPIPFGEFSKFKTMLAFIDEVPVYGITTIESFSHVRIRSIFSKRLQEEEREMMKLISHAGRRLMWEVIRDAKSRDFVDFDFASVNKSNLKSEAIARFKLSFGGAVAPEYNYMYRSAWFQKIEKLVRLKF